MQIGVGIVVERVGETRLQELALDSDRRTIDPKRLLFEEHCVEQLRGRRLDGENLRITRDHPSLFELSDIEVHVRPGNP